MDAESWQSNLDTWRARRRAAVVELALSQDASQFRSPGRSEYDNKGTSCEKEDVVREHLRQLKNSSRRISESALPLIQRNEICSDANTLASISPFPTSETEFCFSSQQISPKQISSDSVFSKDEASTQCASTTRIRLINHADCVIAAHFGMVIASTAPSGGPPFHIQDIVKNSVADKNKVQVGDELLSVDNICCSYTPDRPLIITTLTKLQVLLNRLSARQRSVEVRVLRSLKQDTVVVNSRVSPPAGDRLRGRNGSKYEASSFFTIPPPTPSPSIYAEGERRRKSEDCNGVSLVEIQKVHSPRTPEQQFADPLSDCDTSESIVRDFSSVKSVENGSAPTVVIEDLRVISSDAEPIRICLAETVKKFPQTQKEDLLRTNLSPLPRDETPEPVPCPIGELTNEYSVTYANSSLPPPPSALSIPGTSTPDTTFSICAISPPPMLPSNDRLEPLSPLPTQSTYCSTPEPPSSVSTNERPEPTSYSASLLGFQQNQPLENEMKRRDKDSGMSCEATFDHCSGIEPPGDIIVIDGPGSSLHVTESLSVVEYTNAYSYFAVPNKENLPVRVAPNGIYHQQNELKISDPPVICLTGSTVYPNLDLFSHVLLSDEENPPSRIEESARLSNIPLDSTPEESLVIDEVNSVRLTPSPNDAVGESPHFHRHERTRSKQVNTFMAETVNAECATSPGIYEKYLSAEPQGPPPPKPPRRHLQKSTVNVREPEIVKFAQSSRIVVPTTRPVLKRVPSEPPKNQRNLPPPRPPRVNVIGTWYNCAGCNQQLGTSDLMIVEQLSLFFHLSCFVCSRCGIQLSDGQNETAVRIRNGLIYCYICYHRISKAMSPQEEALQGKKPRSHSDGFEKRKEYAHSSHASSNSYNGFSASPVDDYN